MWENIEHIVYISFWAETLKSPFALLLVPIRYCCKFGESSLWVRLPILNWQVTHAKKQTIHEHCSFPKHSRKHTHTLLFWKRIGQELEFIDARVELQRAEKQSEPDEVLYPGIRKLNLWILFPDSRSFHNPFTA